MWLKKLFISSATGENDVSPPIFGIIAAISAHVELKAGDLILTGTPNGVGPLVPGSEGVGGIDGVGELRVRVV